jgi:hypothetical protein
MTTRLAPARWKGYGSKAGPGGMSTARLSRRDGQGRARRPAARGAGRLAEGEPGRRRQPRHPGRRGRVAAPAGTARPGADLGKPGADGRTEEAETAARAVDCIGKRRPRRGGPGGGTRQASGQILAGPPLRVRATGPARGEPGITSTPPSRAIWEANRGMPEDCQGRGRPGGLSGKDVGRLAPSSVPVVAGDLVPRRGGQAGEKYGRRP